jgi:hypothetical protein
MHTQIYLQTHGQKAGDQATVSFCKVLDHFFLIFSIHIFSLFYYLHRRHVNVRGESHHGSEALPGSSLAPRPLSTIQGAASCFLSQQDDPYRRQAMKGATNPFTDGSELPPTYRHSNPNPGLV